jgi:ADP-heptose:LPS heptosyltransferase
MNQIGDVTFALPLASAIKKDCPSNYVLFIGRGYTKDLIKNYPDVDEYVDGEALDALPDERAIASLKALNADAVIHVQSSKTMIRRCKSARIKARIGNKRRLSHWKSCNHLVWVKRKGSPLHETQLDMQFLKGIGLKKHYSLQEIISLRKKSTVSKTETIRPFLSGEKFNLILHTKTRGEHIEWPLSSYAALIESLPKERFNILVTGSLAERDKIAPFLIDPYPHVVDATDLRLQDLQSLISNADGLIAASTGPVHLAANADIATLGLYAPIKPFDAGRWGPVGRKASVLSMDKPCSWCRDGRSCRCVGQIDVEQVRQTVEKWALDYTHPRSLCPEGA